MNKILKIVKHKSGNIKNNNGLYYEKLTELNYNILYKKKYYEKISFGYGDEFIKTNKKSLFLYMGNNTDKDVLKAHGCKEPDECYINEYKRTIFIVEKKFQQTRGSACEKIQTPDFKIWQYNRTFPDYKCVYIYSLSEWFKDNCKAEIEYLNYKKIPFFFYDEYYKKNITEFIVNYK